MTDFEQNLNRVLSDTFNVILKYEEECLRKIHSVPVTVTEAHMIEAINRSSGAAAIGGIAAELGIAPPTVTVAVRKLERKGLVTKTQSETDGRRALVALTDAGRRVDRAHTLFHRKMVRHISGQFGAREKDILLSTIIKLNQFFKHKVGQNES